jgi:EmrB/QacA subfamily drug resistance transporter
LTDSHPYTDEQRRLALASIMIVFVLSAVSQTVVATAMPRIVAELKGLHLYAWTTTAYLLASTVSVPVWGKLGDIFGRKWMLLIGIGLFVAGSCLSGLAGEFGDLPVLGGGMIQLIIARALQGLGGGSIFPLTFAIIAEIFAPRERAQYSGLLSAVYGVGSIIGPVVGGFFTDHGTVRIFGHLIEGWRWVFYVNVPFALAAAAMIVAKMPDLGQRRGGKIDYPGVVLIVAAFLPLLLAVTWGGRERPWGSPLILGLLGFGAASLVAFFVVERAAWDPIVPLDLFKDRVFTTANGAAFIYQMAFLGLTSFMPLYIQLGQGLPATESGLIMLSILGGMIVSSTVAGQIVTRTGKYKSVMVISALILTVGAVLLVLVGPKTTPLGLALRLLVVGVGLGPSQSLFVLAVQNAIPAHLMGVATSSTQFVRQIGGTIGVALFGAILTSSLASELASRSSPDAAVRRLDLGDLQRLAIARGLHPGQIMTAQAEAAERMIRECFSIAIHNSLVFSLSLLVGGFLLMLAIPALPLRDRHVEPKADEEAAAA